LGTLGDVRHYITIDGIVFDIPTNEYGGAFTAHGGNQQAPYARPGDGSTYIRFINNEVRGGGNSGGVSSFSTGMGQAANHRLWTIAGNYFHDVGMAGTLVGAGAFSYHIYLSGSDNLIENNIFGRASGWAIHGYSTSDYLQRNVIRNNYFYNTGGGGGGPGILLCGSGQGPGTGNQIYNNIMYDMGEGNYHGAYQGSIVAGLYGGCAGVHANDNLIYNNTIVAGHGSSGQTGCITVGAGGLEATRNVVRNNICWHNAPTDQIVDGSATGGNTLDHNLTGPDPLFAGTVSGFLPADTNYKLQAGSPAIDAGVSTASGTPTFTTDYGGNQRQSGNGQDLGAWEMGGSPLPPPPQDPIAWWPFDEASGTTAQDITGNSHDLTLTTSPGPTFGPGRIGAHGLVCDGVAGGSASTPVLTGLTQYTWTAWLKGVESPVSTRVSIPFFNGTTGDQFGFAWDHTVAADRQSAFHRDAGGAYTRLHIPLTPLLAAGAWTHIAATWDGSTWILYVGGVEKDRRTGLSTLFAPGGSFSVCSSAGASPWSGTIDELKLWGRALSATEVANEVAAAKKAVRHTVVVQ
jgi:hypothetical protein